MIPRHRRSSESHTEPTTGSRRRGWFTARRTRRDDGMILPMVFVGTVLVSVVTLGVATYVTSDLRYSNVIEGRADRLAAADGGLRFGIERLRNFQTLCTTAAGRRGVVTVFPPLINGATTTVTCQSVGTPISDIQGWGVVVTGQGVPASSPIFYTRGTGQSDNFVKTFSGPVYVTDPTRMSLFALLKIKDGDLWYSSNDCSVEVPIPELDSGDLTFDPDFLRGPQCIPDPWTSIFEPPTVPAPPTSPLNPSYTTDGSCRVFSPGKYTSLSLGTNNYFKTGAYYFEDVTFDVQGKHVIGGFPGDAGDAEKVGNTACAAAQAADKALKYPAESGATFYLGGDSKFQIKNNASIEIFRRLVGETYLSAYTLPTSGSGYKASTLTYQDWALVTQSGSTNDVAMHGLFWAPKAGASLGNVVLAANGQLLGGIVVALLDTQAANATAFHIGIESNPISTRLLLVAASTLNGCTTKARAVVQFRPDTGDLAVNSWRVADQTQCT
ncbi:MAG: hypothetical protein ACO3C1_08145 [Ilumatobacteraceae bacterium]